MRAAEKTVAPNFCKGLPLVVGHNLLWLEFTKKQEVKSGL